jgi:ribosomal-protein-alanine N-acetyltransferase
MHPIYADARVMRWVGGGPVRHRRDTAAMLFSYAEHQRQHGFSCWAVIDRASGRLLGDAGLSTRGQSVELGYTLGFEHWRRGYATEAAQLCIDAAFGALGMDTLSAVVVADNVASVAVLTKLGFVHAGEVMAYDAPHAHYRLAYQATRWPR